MEADKVEEISEQWQLEEIEEEVGYPQEYGFETYEEFKEHVEVVLEPSEAERQAFLEYFSIPNLYCPSCLDDMFEQLEHEEAPDSDPTAQESYFKRAEPDYKGMGSAYTLKHYDVIACPDHGLLLEYVEEE